jgi:hypothetical protein
LAVTSEGGKGVKIPCCEVVGGGVKEESGSNPYFEVVGGGVGSNPTL